MDTTIEQQVAMDEALVPHAQRSNTKTLKRAMRCTILGSRRLSSTISCQRIPPFRRGTRKSNAYKEYYAVATGAAPPKPKASVWRTRNSSDTSITPPTAAVGLRLTTTQKGKQTAKAPKAKSLSALSEVAMTEAQQLKLVTKRSLQQTHISQASGSGADEGTGSIPGVLVMKERTVMMKKMTRVMMMMKTMMVMKVEVARDDDKDDDEEGGDDEQEYDDEEYAKETKDEENFDPIPQTPKNSKDEGDGEEDLGLNVGEEERHVEDEEEDKLYRDVNINQGRGIQATLEVEDSHVTLTPVNPDGQQQSSSVSSKFVMSMLNPILVVGMELIFETTSQLDVQTPTSVAPFPMTAPTMNEAVKVAVQIQSDRLRDKAQRENYEFVKTVDENIKKIIKEQVKEQVKVQVFKILPRIEQAMNEQFKAEVLTRSSHSSKTSYVVDADLSEMELKKIPIEKMEGNKSIQCLDERRNLYKALVEAYESYKIILDIYGETVTLKRRRDDADKDEEPSAGPDRGSKRRREGKEPKSASAPMENATRSVGRSHKSLVELEYHLEEVFKATTDQLEWVNPEGASSRKYTTSITKTKAADYRHIKWIEDLVPRTMWIEEPIGYDKHALWGVSHWGRKRQQFYGFPVNRESARDVYSKRRIITITKLKIVELHSYKHLDWIMVRRDDDKLYKFKEGDFKRLRIQDIEYMLLLLV
uniref:Uncharacterized protein n=1 Tax=Tanacetum cinerariifolium TaxID=118510 RepID=A0A699I5S9_TANCI|nr:hypothetical protein [Tanacetum cinerariifolium]